MPGANSVGHKLRSELLTELDKMPVDILSEFFSRSEISKDLFSVAKSLESRAYGRTFAPPGALEPHGQAVLGVFLDYFGIDRREFLT
jgi:hypothetical protein